MATPSLAVYFKKHYNKELTLLEIDDRFDYLEKFIKFDLEKPDDCLSLQQKQFRFESIVFDPPFFAVSLSKLN